MTYEYRKLSGRADAKKACVFLDQMATETIFTNQYPGQPPRDLQKMAEAYADKNNFFLGVFEGERLLGTVSCTIRKPQHPWCNFNASFGISILKEIYGKGIASKLMDEMIKWAYDKGLHRIEGQVRTTNERALRLYLKKGFMIEGIHREDAFIDGKWHDSYSIAKLI